MNDAIRILFWWRYSFGVENAVVFDQPYMPPSQYEMCSPATREYAEILVGYRYANCCDDRPLNFYPLLDRITAWIDKTYGS